LPEESPTIIVPKPVFVTDANGFVSLGAITIASTCAIVDACRLTGDIAAILVRALNADPDAARDVLVAMTAPPAASPRRIAMPPSAVFEAIRGQMMTMDSGKREAPAAAPAPVPGGGTEGPSAEDQLKAAA